LAGFKFNLDLEEHDDLGFSIGLMSLARFKIKVIVR